MRTEKQSEASRINGSQSQGPATSEGKVASSRNALKHGLTSRNPILLDTEDEKALNNLRETYHAELRPVGQIENDIVEELASTKWRRQRGEAIEAAIISVTIARQAPEIDRCFVTCPQTTKIALAYMHLIDESKSLATIQRQNSRLSRQYLKLLKTLRELQAERPDTPAPAPSPEPDQQSQPELEPEAEIRQNEPEPVQPVPDQQHAGQAALNLVLWLARFLRASLPAASETKVRAAGSAAQDTENGQHGLETA